MTMMTKSFVACLAAAALLPACKPPDGPPQSYQSGMLEAARAITGTAPEAPASAPEPAPAKP
jgi:hypothetical protein